jgi:hypothetical protein
MLGIPNLTRMGTNKSDYLWVYDGILTSEEAADLQRLAGFDRAGYGFFNFVVKNDNKSYWKCAKSCD